MSVPRLSALHVYPVKALTGSGPAEAAVEPWGLAGDRRWMLVDGGGRQLTQRAHPRLALVRPVLRPGGPLTVSAPGMPALDVPVPAEGPAATVEIFGTPVRALLASEEAGAWFSRYLGDPARLVYMNRPEEARPVTSSRGLPGETVSFADGFPVHLTTTASLAALNLLIEGGDRAEEGPVPMTRFRPNLVVENTAPWAEDGWREVVVGEVAFRVAKGCGRCVVTTVDQSTGARGGEPLRTLGRHRRSQDGLVFGQLLVPLGPGTVRVGDAVHVAR